MVKQEFFAFLLMLQIACNRLGEATAGEANSAVSTESLATEIENLRIFDGDILTNAVPYMAQLRIANTGGDLSNSFVLCGATVLTDRHLLTAAQCFRQADAGRPFYAVFSASVIESTNLDELSYQEFRYQDATKHEEHRVNNGLRVNDVAIVTLPERINLACGITTVCLDGSKKLHHKNLFAAGWGRVNCQFTSRFLLFATTRTFSNDNCKQIESEEGFYDEISDSHYCTKHFPNAQSVKTAPDKGDWGGPLMSYSFGNQDVQVGILSGNDFIERVHDGDVLLRCSDPDKPTVSIRVSSYKSFILQHAPDARFCRN